MNRREIEVQEALGTLFKCQGCGKPKSISEKSDGGVYSVNNFCLGCLKAISPFSDRLILSERHYKAGYVLREELWDDRYLACGGHGVFMKIAYTPSGDYIGEFAEAYLFCVKYGIAPEKRKPSSNVCSIGYSRRRRKYYGWSHRAMVGFAIGDKIFEERFGGTNTLFRKHGRKTIRNKEDQRKSAIAFAKHVS